MDFDEVRKYWEERASQNGSAQSTTRDYYLRDIEFRVIRTQIEQYKPQIVMDAGCGDAWTTARLATRFNEVKFIGVDYSEAMVENAQVNINRMGINNVHVILCDVSKPLPLQEMDMVYSTRCLINLPSWELQQAAIRNIAGSLRGKGIYLMIENFIESHDNFNQVRREFGLAEIPVRDHNLFLNRVKLLEFASSFFEILNEVNISSTYYLVSRIIYSKICQDNGATPDYFDVHHELASKLPFCGEYGPVRMICMRRR